MRAFLYHADHTEQLDRHSHRGDVWHTHAYCDLDTPRSVGDEITVVHPFGRSEQFRIEACDDQYALAVAR